MRRLVLLAGLLATSALSQPSDAFRERVPDGAEAEVLAEGFVWSEGPVWRPAEGDLLFSDVPGNTVWRWSDADGLSVFLRPSGLALAPGQDASVGSNGLILDAEGRLLLADHGSRAVTRLIPGSWVRETVADRYDGRRFNSPNDLALHSSGALFVTDPPYGLAGRDASPDKEQPHNGVYRIDPDGTVALVIDDLTWPNGVILSPNERTLYVANSDPAQAIWRAYPVAPDGSLGEGRLLFDATSMVGEANPGLPDGMAMADDGTLFATGPGGVLLLAPDGTHWGTIQTERATANVTFGDDGHALYLTSHDRLLRLRVTARGVGFGE
ncbi:SMP-30/gluconolactonase/LRE family protein [Rubrivirga sp. IMCC45206]|uniref:SMP-30/gluconolactonase/LRE family protein n=1 Tax=Rubrivirga sp. IMCC45206 TaxID=3391614 RepID=UPI00399033EB